MKWFIIGFFLAELIATVWYIRSGWPVRTKSSFYVKILAASIFTVYGILLAVLIGRGVNVSFLHNAGTNELSAAANTFVQFPNGTLTSRVVHLIIAALVYGWLGDFLLGLAHQIGDGADTAEEKDVDYKDQLKNKKTAVNALGVLSFFLGHVLYAVAFGRALVGYQVGFHWWSILLFLLPLAVYLFIGVKLKLGNHMAPLGAYFVALSAMFGLSMTLGICLIHTSAPFAACLITGSLFFAIADLGLSLESYGGEKFQNFALRAVRQVAYFMGQMLLATTILFFYIV